MSFANALRWLLCGTCLALGSQGAPQPASRPTAEDAYTRMKAKATDPQTLAKEGGATNACPAELDAQAAESFRTQVRLGGSTAFNAVPGQVMVRNPILEEEKTPRFYAESERQDASAFTFSPIQGQAISLSDLKGQPVVVFLFRPECEFTADVLPDIIRYQKMESKFGFKVVPVSLASDGWSGLTRWRTQNHTSIPAEFQMFRPSSTPGQGTSVFKDFKVVPTIYLIDSEGRIAWRIVGAMKGSLADKLNLLLAEARLKAERNRPGKS